MISRVLLLLAGLALCGCANAGRAYAERHPELSPAQKQILSTGQVPNGEAIAGLTHEQVRIAMNGYPATFDRIKGEEAWIYLRKKTIGTTERDADATTGSNGRPEPFAASDNSGPALDVNMKTAIFFQGDRATHAEISEEKP